MTEATTDTTIRCADGFSLAGSFVTPREAPHAAVLIAPATGIRRGFYRAFAAHLASQGYAVLTYDNRGIGDSRRGPLRGFSADLVAWGRLDQAAALDALERAFPAVRYHLVGHSAGGQLVGLMPNANKLTSLFNVACSSGSLRQMRGTFFVKAHIFMNLFVPMSNALLGYTHSPLLGMGEPLPAPVARDWARWCNGRGYVKVDLDSDRIPADQHRYDELTAPSAWLWATDDDIATEANVREMAAVFSRSPATLTKLTPKDHGLADIGHMKFFRIPSLWPLATQWLEAHP